MAKLRRTQLMLVLVACIVSDYIIQVHAQIWEEGRKLPLTLDDIRAIREHNGLTCGTKETIRRGITATSEALEGTNDATNADTSTSSTNAGTTIKSSTNNEDTTSVAASTSTDAGSTITSSANNEDITSVAASTSTGCSDYLGMENHQITDLYIHASGYKYDNYPQNGRLNAATRWWGAATAAPWIQADIGYQTNVSGVITQGGGSSGCCWVTELKVSTFENNTNDQEIFVKDKDGNLKIFNGNSDENSLKESSFPYPVYARVVRITCLASRLTQWMMRFEILGSGCNHQ